MRVSHFTSLVISLSGCKQGAEVLSDCREKLRKGARKGPCSEVVAATLLALLRPGLGPSYEHVSGCDHHKASSSLIVSGMGSGQTPK